MVERNSGARGGSNGEMDRREFIKILTAGAAGTLVGTAAGSELLDSGSPERHEEAVGRIVAFSEKQEKIVKSGEGIDNFFYGSGWDKEGYSRDSYHDALKLVNKETHPETNLDALQETAGITILVKTKKERE